MLNKFVFAGRLTADPEAHQTKDNKTFVTFDVAISDNFNKDNPLFQKCIANGYTANYINKYVTKGDLVTAVATLRANDYTNKEGRRIKTTIASISELQSFGKRQDGGNQSNQQFGGAKVEGYNSYDSYDDGSFSGGDLPF